MNLNFAGLNRYYVKRAPFLTFTIIAIGLLYLFSEAYYLIKLLPTNRADFTVYHQASVKVLSGKIPFLDFRLEYPVFALIPIVVPGIVNLLFHSAFESYCVLFALQNIAYGAATAFIMARIVGVQADKQTRLISYALFCLFFMPMFLFRYDSFPVFLTACILLVMPGRPFLAGLLLVVAVGAKLYPLIFAPVLFFYYLLNGKYKKLGWFVAGGIVACLVTLGIALPFTGLTFFDFLKYHGQRGIQLESVASGLILLLHQFGLGDVQLANNYGSYNIETSATQPVLQLISIATPVVFLVLLTLIVWVFRHEKRTSGNVSTDSAIHAFALLLLAFLLLNKVMSPQYMIWLFPFVPFLNRATQVKFVIVLMLTITIYPGWYYFLTRFNPLMIVILNIRNLLLLWMFADILTRLLNGLNANRRSAIKP